MLIVDVETTGLDPNRNSIVSIGALNFEKPSERFYMRCRIFDGAEVTEQALRVNGETMESITDDERSSEENAVYWFLQWAENQGDRTIAGENPRFDLEFLKAGAERGGHVWTLGYRTVDLHTLTYAHHLRRSIPVPMRGNVSGISRDFTLRYVGLPEEPFPHKAYRCIEVEAEAFSRLLYGENLLREFTEYPIPRYLK